ncbi:hypothetical protein AAG906_014328 [Vitis piasezkii]
MPASSNKKELQCLTGRLAALGHFIARFTDKLRHFFLTLKGANTIGWTSECGWAFNEVKRYLTQPPILSSPQSDEQLYIAVLFRHVRDKEQSPVYYVSKAMVDIETQYYKLEQTSLALKSIKQAIQLGFLASNNEAKYEAILVQLELARSLTVIKLKICSDSQLVIGQIQKEYEAKDECMAHYLALVQDSLAKLGEWLCCYLSTSMPHHQLCLCQYVKYASIPRMPSKVLNLVTIDSLPVASTTKKFLLVDADYFSKWVEVETPMLASKTRIFVNNEPQFDSNAFRTFCSELKIKNLYCTLRRFMPNWLPGVLWAYRTTLGLPTWTTLFALTYGMEAIIPNEIDISTIKIALERHLDWADEVRGTQPSECHLINKELLPITLKRLGYACSEPESWSSKESLRIRPRNSRKIGKNPMS